jgi:hypothetical protein
MRDQLGGTPAEIKRFENTTGLLRVWRFRIAAALALLQLRNNYRQRRIPFGKCGCYLFFAETSSATRGEKRC